MSYLAAGAGKRQPATGEQVETARATIGAILRHPHFARGLDDIRNGRRFDADIDDDFWAYERGRLFGMIAPKSMPLYAGKQLNSNAVRLYAAAQKRGYIR